MNEALFYTKKENGKVKCNLCPRECSKKPGKSGNCHVRHNVDGILYTEVFNQVAAIAVDPIEKKPLYHFHPGKKILSIGGIGCNLHCVFCQNHQISQCVTGEKRSMKPVTSEEIIAQAMRTPDNIGIAYTYNEPFMFYEFMFETAKMAKEHNLKNVVVSNGFVNPGPLKFILPYLDAFNIDLKSFSNKFYQKYTGAWIDPVLETLKIIAKSPAHLEITMLVIPELNDKPKKFHKMVDWIAGELGTNVPLHLSRYHPAYQLETEATPLSTLESFYQIAKEKLQYVYLGNVPSGQHSGTTCPGCGSELIKRNNYRIEITGCGNKGQCLNCNEPVVVF